MLNDNFPSRKLV